VKEIYSPTLCKKRYVQNVRECEARYTRNRRSTTESPIPDATGIFEVWPSDRMILGDEMKYNLIARWREALRT